MTLDTLKMRARYVLAACIVLFILALAMDRRALAIVVGSISIIAMLAWTLAAVADAAANTKKEN